MIRALPLLTLLCLPLAARADDPPIKIRAAYAYETAGRVGGAYLTIANNGDTPDVLIAVSGDVPRVMLHQTTETDGIARMRSADRLELPAHGTLTLAPGGAHVMFMGLTTPWVAGQIVPATLTFEVAGDIPVNFRVISRTETPPKP